MAYILIEVDDIKMAGKEPVEYKEIEGIIFRDDAGNEKRHRLIGFTPQSLRWMKLNFPDIDWDEKCCHLGLIVGDQLK